MQISLNIKAKLRNWSL